MKNIIEFLEQIRVNNDRGWFEANKAWYKEVQAEFNMFAAELIERIASFDRSVEGLSLRDCTYRIYRDTRFSTNKDPYKTHMGVYICRGGKKAGFAGYYFHVEPLGDGMLGGNFMTSGLYLPEPTVLNSVREEILDNGEAFETAARKATGFTLDCQNRLKRLPKGFVPGSAYDEYLKMKDIYLTRGMSNEELTAPGLSRRVADNFRLTYDFIELINRAVEYAYEMDTDNG